MVSRTVSVAVAAVCLVQLAGCGTVEVLERLGRPPPELDWLAAQKIVAVVDSEGEAIRFDSTTSLDAAEVDDGSTSVIIRATVSGEPYEINIDDVIYVTIETYDTSSRDPRNPIRGGFWFGFPGGIGIGGL